MTVHIAIGNTDNRLTQQDWARYWEQADELIRGQAEHVHGTWVSPSVAPYQNACWGIEPPHDPLGLRNALVVLARDFEQDSIAWTEGETEFLRDASPAVSEQVIDGDGRKIREIREHWTTGPGAIGALPYLREAARLSTPPTDLCLGRDPAYPNQACPLPNGHPGGCFGDLDVDA